jgi:hypothetical protein
MNTVELFFNRGLDGLLGFTLQVPLHQADSTVPMCWEVTDYLMR